MAILQNKKALITIGVLLVLVIGGGLILTNRTHHASFCTSCHYMEPYVRHWKASGHADVECYKCHDYGVGRLTLSAIKYATGTFSPRPKANVHDESCLSSGCHEVRLLQGKTEFRKGIVFDHAVHLEKVLRGEKLRCTSCHNQIVQYDEEISQGHMAVNDKACFVCHFKDAGQGEAITGCDACHGMPKDTVEHAGFKFDHGPYLKLGVECKQCHTMIVKGDGAVPEAKCYSCHVERSRADYTREQLHQIHVTTNGIDCFKCHTDIEHGNFEMVSALEITCENCHIRQHNRPKQMYMGIGGKDTLDMPSAMFAAQVSCTGCHTHTTPQGEPLAHQEKKEAQRVSCVTCHGKGYDLMFDNWLEGTKAVLDEYDKYLKSVKADFVGIGGSQGSRSATREAIGTAEYNFEFVKDGHIPHNIRYALYLLNSSADRVQSAMTGIKDAYQSPDRGASLKPENSCMAFCHAKTLPEFVSYGGKQLPHLMHVKDLEQNCRICHSITVHGKTEIDKAACGACHE
ncbi:MAG: cytochrome c3 family protein [Candidatus Zixiibacteriota bacterium]